jgi:hypothetical protein
VKKILALVSAVVLFASPVVAQEMPEPGTVVVMAGIYDGVDVIPVEGYIVIPPLACDPE